jgi:hypothetical protein
MRTTVMIDDDVLSVARALAERNGVSLGRALSELARRGFRTDAAVAEHRQGGGRRVGFAVDPGADPITSADVQRALSDWP